MTPVVFYLNTLLSKYADPCCIIKVILYSARPFTKNIQITELVTIRYFHKNFCHQSAKFGEKGYFISIFRKFLGPILLPF